MALLTGERELRATGLASPAKRYALRSAYKLIELDAPDWADQTLAAAGRYEPLDDEDFDERTRIEAARFDGIDKLRRRVEALVIQKSVTVERFLGRHRELKDDVVVFLSGARVVGEPRARRDESVEVNVRLGLRRMWLIVRRGMRTVEVDPPDSTGASTQPAGGGAP